MPKLAYSLTKSPSIKSTDSRQSDGSFPSPTSSMVAESSSTDGSRVDALSALRTAQSAVPKPTPVSLAAANDYSAPCDGRFAVHRAAPKRTATLSVTGVGSQQSDDDFSSQTNSMIAESSSTGGCRLEPVSALRATDAAVPKPLPVSIAPENHFEGPYSPPAAHQAGPNPGSVSVAAPNDFVEPFTSSTATTVDAEQPGSGPFSDTSSMVAEVPTVSEVATTASTPTKPIEPAAADEVQVEALGTTLAVSAEDTTEDTVSRILEEAAVNKAKASKHKQIEKRPPVSIQCHMRLPDHNADQQYRSPLHPRCR